MGLSSISTAALAFLLVLAGSATADTCTQNRLHTTYPAPVAADGWSYRLIAHGLQRPRSILFDDSGALLVLESGKGVTRLTFDDSGGSCLGVKEHKTVVANAAVSGVTLRWFGLARLRTRLCPQLKLGADRAAQPRIADPQRLAAG